MTTRANGHNLVKPSRYVSEPHQTVSEMCVRAQDKSILYICHYIIIQYCQIIIMFNPFLYNTSVCFQIIRSDGNCIIILLFDDDIYVLCATGEEKGNYCCIISYYTKRKTNRIMTWTEIWVKLC